MFLSDSLILAFHTSEWTSFQNSDDEDGDRLCNDVMNPIYDHNIMY